MQITAAPPRPETVVTIRPGQLPPAAPPTGMDINDPAARFARVYVNDVFALMGAVTVSYGSGSADTVRLGFLTHDLAKLADGVLRDTVLGAKLVYTDPKGVPFDMSKPASDWVTYPTNYARAVAAMPSVASYRWYGENFLFDAGPAESRVRLAQLIERQLGGRFTAYIKGECTGPGCKPDPAPPTGEV